MKVSTCSFDCPAEGAPVPVVPGYRLLECIGHGGMGEVWAAEQLATGRKVAIKYIKGLRIDSSARAAALGRFQREIELAARFDHPHIARVFDGGEVMGRPWCVMEFIEGDTLADYVKKAAPPQRVLLTLMERVADAVQHAHQRFVIHRDLKPVNIMITRDGEPKLLDFGLAKALEGDGSDNMTLSVEGMIAGTPAFMSPEQAAGDIRVLDARTDVYSLGVILYLLLTGQHPHDVSGPAHSVLVSIATTDIRRPRLANPQLDAELEMLLLRALARQPAARYQSAAELRDEIRRWLDGYPLLAGAADWRYFTRKFLQRHRLAVSAAAAVLIAGAAGVVYHIVSLQEEKDEAARQAAAAREARSSAEDLIEEMIGSLKSDLEPLGRLDLLDRVAQSSREYFNKTPVNAGTGGSPRQRALMLTNLGEIALNRGHSAEARRLFEQSASVWQQVLPSPSDAAAELEALIGWSVATRRIAEVAIRHGAYQEPDKLLADALTKTRWGSRSEAETAEGNAAPEPTTQPRWGEAAPEPTSLLRERALLHETQGDLRLTQRNYTAALTSYTSFLESNRQATAASGTPSVWQRETVWALTKCAQAHLALKQPGEALPMLKQAGEVLSALRTQHPEDLQLARDAALLEDKLGDAADEMKNLEEARTHYSAATAQLEKLCEFDPSNRKWLTDLAIAQRQEGGFIFNTEPTRAAELLAKARATLAAFSTADPANLDILFHFANTDLLLGNKSDPKSNSAAALQHYHHCLTRFRNGLDKAPDELRWRKGLVHACLRTGILIFKTDAAEANKLFDEAISVGAPVHNDPEVTNWLNTLQRLLK